MYARVTVSTVDSPKSFLWQRIDENAGVDTNDFHKYGQHGTVLNNICPQVLDFKNKGVGKVGVKTATSRSNLFQAAKAWETANRLDYEHSLNFFLDSKASATCERPGKFPPARKEIFVRSLYHTNR